MKSRATTSQMKEPWSRPWEEVLQGLRVSKEVGLTSSEAEKRRKAHGPNRLQAATSKPAWIVFVDQLKNFIILLLAVAAGLSFAFGQWLEGFSIVAAILINVAIGFFTELKAVRSMESLRRLSRVRTKVIRDGEVREMDAVKLVPGDLIPAEAGDLVAADLRLMEASRLKVDESALTGESFPVEKDVDALENDVPLAERRNMLFKGTAVTEGSGQGIVVATGMDTELGKISSLAEEAEEEATPLEHRLRRLGHRLIWITLLVAISIIGSGIIAGKEAFLIIETAIALAVAAIPEGLPIVATIALAQGMWRMARHNALINRLYAVEALGSTTLICTDKTGTLTENRMTVSRVLLASRGTKERMEVKINGDGNEGGGFFMNGREFDPLENQIFREAVEVGMLCNNAGLNKGPSGNSGEAVGDPMEVALLHVGIKAGLDRDKLLESMPEEREEAFDPDLKMMATIHRSNRQFRVAVKGAPEAVLDVSNRVRTADGDMDMNQKMRNRWREANDRMAEQGLRVLAVGMKSSDEADADPYRNLAFLGLLGLSDPPRGDVKEAIETCREAGIRVVMVTGDQPETARQIGLDIGITGRDEAPPVHGKDLKKPEEMSEEERDQMRRATIFARVTPEQKLDLITLHQEAGAIVAMTGDGINDAPALKKADIGIAMGRRGTEVAREAADVVLKDDAFSTIVIAIAQGRAIFDNIRKFIVFLLSGNVGEIMIVAFPLLLGAPLPVLPLQILYLNMIGDVFPALALGVGKGDPSKMNHPPRDSSESVITRHQWVAIFGYGLLIALPVLGSFALALHRLKLDMKTAVTISFLTLAFARLWHVFNMRDQQSKFLQNHVTKNPFVWGALILCVALLVAAVYLPGLSLVLHMVRPDTTGWILVIGMSLIPWIIGQGLKHAKGI